MQVRRPSASGLDRAFDCPPSCWLPENPPGKPSPVAAKGSRIHTAVERAYQGVLRDEDIYAFVRPEEVPEAQRAVRQRPRVAPAPTLPIAEVESWYEPHSVTALRGSLPDEPPARWARGRSDFVGFLPTPWIGIDAVTGAPVNVAGKLCVGDTKTGNPTYQKPAHKSNQIAFHMSWTSTYAPDLCRDGICGGVYLTKTGTFDVYWFPRPWVEAWQERMAGLWALLDLVEDGLLPDDDPRRQMSCKTNSSKWCSVQGCRRNV